MIRVLALDTSTHTGWAACDETGLGPVYGTWKLPGWKPEIVGKAYALLLDLVAGAIREHRASHVVIETPLTVYAHSGYQSSAAKNPDLAEALLGFAAVAEGAATRAGALVYRVAPSTVRKHFIDNGRHPEPKLAVMRRCKALGWRPEDDNQGDALATWDYAKSTLDPGWAHRTTPLFHGVPL